ncbi:Formyltransferase/hydrolase complex Fhc subunit C [Planctomycetes bacterium Pan216]|uniref:Formyltransferase/hydrolase complex Fhc subunit C n=1 Tax=Kolteria novifilia TaxID=2527975 RepID=A0A518BC02_9BACT|nr:Formyltransferase/hydrolase complex Fhc subunit C [Planctomycetes bacterium Pan216]
MLSIRPHADLDHVPFEVDGLSPDRLSSMSLEEIARLPAWLGNRCLTLGECSTLEGDPADEAVHLQGDWSRAAGIASGMTSGSLRVGGSIGPRLGAQMTGGEIVVEGDAGDYLGAEMTGGSLHVHGDAGDQVGGPLPGTKLGMKGGTILIRGNAGDEVGGAMRRGLLAVAGSVGNDLAMDMRAGTVVVGGAIGTDAGLGMKRGTLLLLDPSLTPERFHPMFEEACRYEPSFVEIYRRELAKRAFPLPKPWPTTLIRLVGDQLELRKGEIFIGAT